MLVPDEIKLRILAHVAVDHRNTNFYSPNERPFQAVGFAISVLKSSRKMNFHKDVGKDPEHPRGCLGATTRSSLLEFLLLVEAKRA
ncbi:MAG: hypothetical protein Q9192_001097 [Flavoplaca navasiana]